MHCLQIFELFVTRFCADVSTDSVDPSYPGSSLNTVFGICCFGLTVMVVFVCIIYRIVFFAIFPAYSWNRLDTFSWFFDNLSMPIYLCFFPRGKMFFFWSFTRWRTIARIWSVLTTESCWTKKDRKILQLVAYKSMLVVSFNAFVFLPFYAHTSWVITLFGEELLIFSIFSAFEGTHSFSTTTF